jgi:SAM-dependent methyltransferase
MTDVTLPPDYFARLYDEADDPWRISTGWYERRKRALVLAALPQERVSIAFEPGCSNGELTAELAHRCDRLIAWDLVESAVERTRARTTDSPGVEVRQAALPSAWPDEVADLIVIGEVGYYLAETDLQLAVDGALAHLSDGGTLLAVHWRHPAPDYPLRGDEVHAIIDARAELERLGRYRDDDFVLDVWTRGPAASVARQHGVL